MIGTVCERERERELGRSVRAARHNDDEFNLALHNCLHTFKLFQVFLFDISSSSSCRAAGTDITDPLSTLFPIVHRLWQVFRDTSRILT